MTRGTMAMSGAALIAVLGLGPRDAAAECVGDCSHDAAVTVDEILTMVNIALGNADVAACTAGDANADSQITVDEILTAVNNALLRCPNAAPIARAHPRNRIPDVSEDIDRQARVTLDGSESSDPDGDELRYRWEQIGGPLVELDDPTSATPSFEPQEVGVYAFQLIVNDGRLDSEPDETSVRVFDIDVIPIPPAGTTLAINEPTTLTLEFHYAGIYPGSELHVQVWPARLDPTPLEDNCGSDLLVTEVGDFEIPAQFSPNPVLAFIVGSYNLANVGVATEGTGTVTAELTFTPPQLRAEYNGIVASIYAVRPDPFAVLIAAPDCEVRYPVVHAGGGPTSAIDNREWQLE